MTLIQTNPDRIYTRQELDVFNLLEHPIWVFDMDCSAMWFGNTAALHIWNAATLEELLQRDYKSDMSQATYRRLQEAKKEMALGTVQKEHWTYYPKGQAITLRVTGSAIRIEGGRIAAIYEADFPNEEMDQSAVRGNEMLRHLPMAVCQFTMDGNVAYQNPEAVVVFGTPPPNEKASSSSNPFLNRFVDRQVGRNALEQVQAGKDHNVDAECYTQDGSRWFSLAMRRAKDPVTAANHIISSARDITEIIQARKDKTQANLKNEFTSVIAHELRTPLHQIVGYLDLLEQTELSDVQRETVAELQSSGQLMLIIINDLLDYSKLESGKLQIENVPFALEGVCSGCLDAMATELENKRLMTTRDIMKELPAKVMGDPNRIRQILLNLLSNAIKFTPSGGQITLTVTPIPSAGDNDDDDGTKSRIRFQVTDTGIGIAPDHQKKLFQKYQQANASVARNFGGTGLGLAICKGLVDAMGGTIGLTSELDKGTTIFFEVPFEIPVGATESSLANPIVGSSADDNTESLRILLVEDNQINQKLARRMLEGFGHTVTIADNGQLAVDHLRRDSSYHLALVDIMMPVMDGIECTNQIRNVVGLSKEKLPIVGLTASFKHADLDYYRRIGMNECIGKPLRMADLKKAIATNALQQHRDLSDSHLALPQDVT